MANVIKTVYTYPLDGTTTDFTIPFEYLARKFVVITLIGVDRKELVVVTDYRFATRTTISTTRAWGPSDGYQQIEIRRYTSATERLVDFSDGSILRAQDLNVAQVQTLHVAEEARDLTADTIGVNNDGNLDARGRRIVNVADGVEPGDAITLGQVTAWNESALNSKNAAKVSEDNAKSSETKAKTSETNAKTSETNSKNSENLAHDWAQKAENVVVTGTEYSAYHYSRKASASASASSASAAAALASQNAAKTSETNADESEFQAKEAAQQAKTEADKLTNMNAFASLIDSTDTTAKLVKFKAHWTEVTDPTSPDADKRSYRSRWEATGTTTSAYGTLEAFRNNVDGGLYLNVSFDGATPVPFFFVGDGTFNTSRLLTRLDSGKDPLAFPSVFSQSVILDFHGNSARFYSNGDIVSEKGGNIFANAGANSLGSFVNNTVVEVYIGAFARLYAGPGTKDVSVPSGCVMTGFWTNYNTADGTYLQDVFYRALWQRFGDGRRLVVGQI